MTTTFARAVAAVAVAAGAGHDSMRSALVVRELSTGGPGKFKLCERSLPARSVHSSRIGLRSRGMPQRLPYLRTQSRNFKLFSVLMPKIDLAQIADQYKRKWEESMQEAAADNHGALKLSGESRFSQMLSPLYPALAITQTGRSSMSITPEVQ
eukprot:300923-Pelagomonas_calceolata.AAC.1